MAKQRIVVNGYPVPTGFSGVAVRRACELVVASPGIRQADPTRPTAACRATLTFMENLRPNIPTASRPAGKAPPAHKRRPGCRLI